MSELAMQFDVLPNQIKHWKDQLLEGVTDAHRRTFATVAMEAGVLEEIVGRLLNHTPLSITGQRYLKSSLDALRPAMGLICTALQARAG